MAFGSGIFTVKGFFTLVLAQSKRINPRQRNFRSDSPCADTSVLCGTNKKAGTGSKGGGSSNNAKHQSSSVQESQQQQQLQKNSRLCKADFDSIKGLVFDMAVIRHQTEALNAKVRAGVQ